MIIALLISLFLLLGMPMMGQNPTIALPADGDWPTIVGDSIMLIGPKQDSLTEEQRYFNPPYLLIYPGKEHLKNDMICATLCDCDPTQPNRRIGVFSVAPDKQVSFSQGNLQYLPAIHLWKFANTQYESLGNANKYLKPTFRNWVDLFGWSANNTTAPFGVSTSTNAADYAGDFVDWGTNTICGDAPGTWRTLSADEWEYLFEKRKNALQLRSKGSINGHRGHILLPDDWVLPEGMQFVAEPDNLTMELDINTYTPAEWSIMEEAGAVFLPAAGRRDGTTVGYLVEYSGVWSSSSTTNTNAFHTYYNYESQIIAHHWTSATSRINGRSVRLVHDTIVPKVEPEYVDLGLSVKWATFNVGASKPEDYGDYFAWGETEPKETYSWATYKWCDGTETNITKYNTTDGKTILEPADDAAHVNWGDNWRMPTKAECQELIDSCTWERITLNGVISYKVTGPNGNSIFIPIAGAYNSFDNQLNSVGSIGWIYSSTRATGKHAYQIHFEEGCLKQMNCSRCVGLTIRPVYDDRPPKRIGVFSVAADKQVSFSQGNLQYTQSTDEWRFAREQYEYIGAANIKDGAFADKIDLFGWSADNTTAPFGVSTSTNDADYTGEFVDWGENTICGDAPGTWRTLSADEWEYLLKKRKNASDLYGVAQVAGVNGMIILPDDWEEANGIVFKSGLHSSQVNDYSVYQSFTDAQWLAMENAGAIFLPALGYRDGTNVEKCDTSGYYWSNTTSDEKSAYRLYFYSYFLAPNDVHSKCRGRSVRLVHDTIVPETIPDPNITFEVNGVQYKMIYVEGGNFMMGSAEDDEVVNQNLAAMGDELPQHKVTLDSYYIGEIEVTQKLWKDIMGTDVYDLYQNLTHQGSPEPNVVGDNYPIYYMYTSDMLEFTRKLSKVTGLNFRLPTEAEWEYAARGGNKSKGYLYAGSNNVDDVAWYNDNTNNKGVQLVAQKLPNELGIYDMSGNVLERCLDYLEYHEPYSVEAVHNPRGRISQYGNRAYRGGSCSMHKDSVRVTHRAPQTPTFTSTNVGARLVINDNHHFQTFCVNNVWFDMIFVKGDSSLSDYYIGQIEVTQALWRAVMGNAPGTIQDKNLPVDKVSWNDCQVFIRKLNQLTGYHFRLPTEAEWEYAARGGKKSKGYEYAGSDMIGDVAWYQGNSNNAIHTFAKKLPNELGIYDMSGNVWEWCEDYYDTDETMHVVKSGSFYDSESACRIDSRTGRAADYNSFIGLRLVLDERSTPPEPEYVDLGLSVKWATFNVGAKSSNEIGSFYAWGEIEPKDSYTDNNYKWWNKSSKEITKYCTIDSLAYGGVADGLTELLPQDDVAHILKGEHWRMPNLNECKELVNGCTWTVSTRQGQIGFEGTSKINGNTIFLPVAGFRAGANLVNETLGGYWSSTLNIEKQSCAMGLYLNQETPTVNIYYNSSRQNGFLIRPVYDNRP